MGYRCPWISTGMTRPLSDMCSRSETYASRLEREPALNVQASSIKSHRSEVERFQLFEHFRHPRADDVALFFQRRQLVGEPIARGDSGAHRLELARQALVFFRRAGLLSLHPIDHADQKLQLLFEPIDRFEVHAARRCLDHAELRI